MEIEWDPDDALEARRQSVTQIEDQLSVVKHVEYLKRNEVQNKDICVLVKEEGTRNKFIFQIFKEPGLCARMQRNFTPKLATPKLFLRA